MGAVVKVLVISRPFFIWETAALFGKINEGSDFYRISLAVDINSRHFGVRRCGHQQYPVYPVLHRQPVCYSCGLFGIWLFSSDYSIPAGKHCVISGVLPLHPEKFKKDPAGFCPPGKKVYRQKDGARQGP